MKSTDKMLLENLTWYNKKMRRDQVLKVVCYWIIGLIAVLVPIIGWISLFSSGRFDSMRTSGVVLLIGWSVGLCSYLWLVRWWGEKNGKVLKYGDRQVG